MSTYRVHARYAWEPPTARPRIYVEVEAESIQAAREYVEEEGKYVVVRAQRKLA